MLCCGPSFSIFQLFLYGSCVHVQIALPWRDPKSHVFLLEQECTAGEKDVKITYRAGHENVTADARGNNYAARLHESKGFIARYTGMGRNKEDLDAFLSGSHQIRIHRVPLLIQ